MYTNYKALKRLERRDKLITIILVLDASLFVTGVMAYIVAKVVPTPAEFIPASTWFSSFTCGISILFFILFFVILAWSINSYESIRVAKGERLEVDED